MKKKTIINAISVVVALVVVVICSVTIRSTEPGSLYFATFVALLPRWLPLPWR